MASLGTPALWVHPQPSEMTRPGEVDNVHDMSSPPPTHPGHHDPTIPTPYPNARPCPMPPSRHTSYRSDASICQIYTRSRYVTTPFVVHQSAQPNFHHVDRRCNAAFFYPFFLSSPGIVSIFAGALARNTSSHTLAATLGGRLW